jgi:peptide/nickel transport system permease protein
VTVESAAVGWAESPGPTYGSRNAVSAVARHPVPRVIARRLVTAIPVVFVVSAASFLLISLTPGDAARQLLGTQAPPGTYRRLRAQLGLDLPLYEQYWRWLSHAVRGDLGTSVYTGLPVTSSIISRLAVTLSLLVGALVVGVVLGIAVGVIGAVRGGFVNTVVSGVSLLGFALPSFWVGAELISLFAVKLGWFPSTGYTDFGSNPGEWFRSLVLPVAALSLGVIAAIAKFTREAMLDVLGSSHIRMARASGLSPRKVVLHYALKNALLPVVTVSGTQAVGLLGGTVLVENVFGLPGLGSLALAGASQQDIPVVEGVAVFYTLLVIGIFLVVDLCYMLVDPRVHVK